MGKKARKTRWRTLEIGGESDSEECNPISSHSTKPYGHRPFLSKFTYSSQSTPTRRYQDVKSTRSSSTASETKITFNEDEYTKITTPRQDVLFKKGYLNKPKNYQTQTSTGNSTASTGNSTGNGTPDHQSADGTEGTDLEYESQFVFPNGFVDHNGVYYLNGFEPYPLMMYNPPICYPEYPLSRSKRHSTSSLTESTSPHNEETSQDLSQSGGENGAAPEYGQVYNVYFPGFYYNEVCAPNTIANTQPSSEPRKVKKKRRRRISKSVQQDGSTSSDEYDSSDEAITQIENRVQSQLIQTEISDTQVQKHREVDVESNDVSVSDPSQGKTNEEERINNLEETETMQRTEDGVVSAKNVEEVAVVETNVREGKLLREDCVGERQENSVTEEVQPSHGQTQLEDGAEELPQPKPEEMQLVEQNPTRADKMSSKEKKQIKFNLDAEEFVPRVYRNVDRHQMEANLQFVHPNFIPIPFSHPELGPPVQFLPPGFPMGFIPHDPKLIPNFVNFVPNQYYPKSYEPQVNQHKDITEDEEIEEEANVQNDEQQTKESQEEKPKIHHSPAVDIAKIVSKLEEAAKEQRLQENGTRRKNIRSPTKFKHTKDRFNSYHGVDGSGLYDRRTRYYDRARPQRRRAEKFPQNNIDGNELSNEEKLENQEVKLADSNHKERMDQEIKTETKPQRLEVQPQVDKSREEIRYNSPKHINYKNQYQSPRRFNNYTRNTKPEHSSAVMPLNYSETSKRPPTSRGQGSRYERHGEKPSSPSYVGKKEESTPVKDIIRTTNASSQWISVSNRKKRKNKSFNEEEREVLEEELIKESKSPAEIDVLILTKEEEIMIYADNKTSEDRSIPSEGLTISKGHLLDSKEGSTACIQEPIKSLEVSEVDSFIKMITKEPSPVRVMAETKEILDGGTKIVLQDVQDIEKELLKENIQEEVLTVELEPKEFKKVKETKKKSKKNQKIIAKRIIIKDLDFSQENIEEMVLEKPSILSTSTLNDVPEIPNDVVEDVQVLVDNEEKASEENEKKNEEVNKVNSKKDFQDFEESEVVENVDIHKLDLTGLTHTITNFSTISAATPVSKKSKKKKKTKQPTASSPSSSSTTLNILEESYDFLLDTSALVEEKTNVEVSQELDKMIQKGIFGSLEEKMKSLNVSINDEFFKTLNLDTKQSTPDKGFLKATDFTSILKNTNQLLTKNRPEASVPNKIDIDFSKISLPDLEQPSTSKDCAFFDLPHVKEDQIKDTRRKSNGKLKNKSKKGGHKIEEKEAITKNSLSVIAGGESNKRDGSTLENECCTVNEKSDDSVLKKVVRSISKEGTINAVENRQTAEEIENIVDQSEEGKVTEEGIIKSDGVLVENSNIKENINNLENHKDNATINEETKFNNDEIIEKLIAIEENNKSFSDDLEETLQISSLANNDDFEMVRLEEEITEPTSQNSSVKEDSNEDESNKSNIVTKSEANVFENLKDMINGTDIVQNNELIKNFEEHIEEEECKSEEDQAKIKSQQSKIYEQRLIIGDQQQKVEGQQQEIDELGKEERQTKQEEQVQRFINQQSKIVEDHLQTVKEQQIILEEQPTIVEEQSRIVEERSKIVEEQPKTVEEERKIEEKQQIIGSKRLIIVDHYQNKEEQPPILENEQQKIEEKQQIIEKEQPSIEQSDTEERQVKQEHRPQGIVDQQPKVIEVQSKIVKVQPIIVEQSKIIEEQPKIVEQQSKTVERTTQEEYREDLRTKEVKQLLKNGFKSEEKSKLDVIQSSFIDKKNQCGEISSPNEVSLHSINNPMQVEKKICRKTYEAFELEEEDDSDTKPNNFEHINLDVYEDQSMLNFSEALEATIENINMDNLRPQKSITQAVFEWMRKTRENTPEVEILKSPDTINREFICQGNEEINEEEMPSQREARHDSEEEITIFENFIQENQQDLLDCREPEMKNSQIEANGAKNAIEQGEDVLEVYDSKYGKNEDFLRLKAEIEEHRRKGNHPKHGDLPYRAICCSLM